MDSNPYVSELSDIIRQLDDTLEDCPSAPIYEVCLRGLRSKVAETQTKLTQHLEHAEHEKKVSYLVDKLSREWEDEWNLREAIRGWLDRGDSRGLAESLIAIHRQLRLFF